MANSMGNYTNSLAVIYDADNNCISRTMITGHDRRAMTVEISDALENIKAGARIKLLIIHHDSVSEFNGVLRRPRSGVCEISLFAEHEREGRTSSRHTLNRSGVVNNMIINRQQGPFPQPLNIIIENLSTTGILVKSPVGGFMVGSIIQVEFDAGGKEATVFGKIVRENINDDNTVSYGCQLVFLQ